MGRKKKVNPQDAERLVLAQELLTKVQEKDNEPDKIAVLSEGLKTYGIEKERAALQALEEELIGGLAALPIKITLTQIEDGYMYQVDATNHEMSKLVQGKATSIIEALLEALSLFMSDEILIQNYSSDLERLFNAHVKPHLPQPD